MVRTRPSKPSSFRGSEELLRRALPRARIAVDKPAEYAYEVIFVYLVVHLDGNRYTKIILEYLVWIGFSEIDA